MDFLDCTTTPKRLNSVVFLPQDGRFAIQSFKNIANDIVIVHKTPIFMGDNPCQTSDTGTGPFEQQDANNHE